MERVTVTLNALDPLTKVWMSAWCHEQYVSYDEGGVSFDLPDLSSTFPWSNVLRVDREPCACPDCEQDKQSELAALRGEFARRDSEGEF